MNDTALLSQYVERRCRASLGTLCERYADLVYASALRRVSDPGLAEDVTQAVFIILARKAGTIRDGDRLPVWLHRTTRFIALDALRRRSTRRRHERRAALIPGAAAPARDEVAWAEVKGELEIALDRLNRSDRELILRRFYQQQTLADIAQALGSNKTTVHRRLDKALAHLARQLTRRGVSVPTVGGLATVLATSAAVAAPAGVAAGSVPLALAAGTTTTASAFTLAQGGLTAMFIAKVQTAAAVLVAVFLTVAAGAVAQQAVTQGAARPAPAPIAGTGQIAWEPATRFRSEWITTEFSQVVRNPTSSSNSDKHPAPSLRFHGQIEVRDPTGIVGVDHHAVLTRIVGANGREFFVERDRGGRNSRWYRALEYRREHDPERGASYDVLAPIHVHVQSPARQSIGPRLQRVEGHKLALIAERFEHVDIPFEPSREWTQVLPDVRVRLQTADVDRTQFRYTLTGATDNKTESHALHFSEDEAPPAQIIADVHLIDADGKRLDDTMRVAQTSIGSRYSSSGTVPWASDIAALRIVVAVGLQEREIPFVFENVELPQPAPTLAQLVESSSGEPTALSKVEGAFASALDRWRSDPERYNWNDAKDQAVREQWSAFKTAYERGAVADDPEPVHGQLPDVDSYDEYLGDYTVEAPESQEPLRVTVSRDDTGRFNVRFPDGLMPVKPQRGALHILHDDMLFDHSSRLEADNTPQFNFLVLTRVDGEYVMHLTQRGEAHTYELTRE